VRFVNIQQICRLARNNNRPLVVVLFVKTGNTEQSREICQHSTNLFDKYTANLATFENYIQFFFDLFTKKQVGAR